MMQKDKIIKSLQASNKKLKEALIEFGSHDDTCPVTYLLVSEKGCVCNCGYEKALEGKEMTFYPHYCYDCMLPYIAKERLVRCKNCGRDNTVNCFGELFFTKPKASTCEPPPELRKGFHAADEKAKERRSHEETVN